VGVTGLTLDKDLLQYALVGDVADVRVTGDITVECRVRFASTPTSGNKMYLVAKGDVGDDRRCYRLYLENHAVDGLRFVFQVEVGSGDDSNYIQPMANYSVATGVWYTVRGSIDVSESTGNLFVNGADETSSVITSGSGATINSDSVPLLFGAIWDSGETTDFLDGTIDSVVIAEVYTPVVTNRATVEPLSDYLSSMAGLWSLNSEDGIALEDEINDNRAVLQPPGPGATFNDVQTEYVDCGTDSSLEITGDLSIGFWLWIDTVGTGQKSVVAKWDRAANSSKGYNALVFLDGSTHGKLVFVATNGSGTTRVANKYDFTHASIKRWMHVIMSRRSSDGDAKIFVDGVEKTWDTVSESAGAIAAASGTEFVLGASLNSGAAERYYDGMMAHVRVYDSFISTESEARAEMEAKVSAHASLVEEWTMDGDLLATESSNNDGAQQSGTIDFTWDRPVLGDGFPWARCPWVMPVVG